MLAQKRLSDNTVYLRIRRRADRLLVALKGTAAPCYEALPLNRQN